MGRLPLEKNRLSDSIITEKWIQNLVPYILLNGFYKQNMDSLVKIAGVSKATFYKYFASREDLVDLVIKRKIDEMYSFQDVLFDVRNTYFERYLHAIMIIGNGMSSISNEFLSDLKKAYPQKLLIINEFKNNTIKILEGFYKEGMVSNQIISINPKVTAIVDQMFYTQLFDGEFLAKNGLTVKEAFLSYFVMKNHGLLKREDDKILDMLNNAINNSKEF